LACDRKYAFNKIGNRICGVMSNGIEIVVKEDTIHCVVLLVLCNEFHPGLLPGLSGDDWGAVIWVNKEPDDSI
jgi:hypothetical protein